MQRKIGTYRDNQSGQLYEVVERTKESTYRTLGGQSKTRYGLIDYITTCGLDVESEGGAFDRFEILQTGKVIERI